MDSLNTKIKNILTEKTLKVRPENIKNGVNILGITGNVVELNGETKTITPSTSQQIITPSSGKNAITQATVTAVNSTIDNNIQAENIKKNVNILGVTGTLEEGITPTGTINITENGTVDVTNYAEANVDVQGGSSEYNAKINTKFTDQYRLLINNITEIPEIDTSSLTSMQEIFRACANLISIPNLNTSKVQYMGKAFYYCSHLVNVPILNTSKVTNFNATWEGCYALSDESLNNILYMIANATSYTGTKTLKYLGLTKVQRTTCTTLSNWAAAQAAGWITGD